MRDTAVTRCSSLARPLEHQRCRVWGFVTISTVGYGDFAPITLLGRIIANGRMVGGVIVIGVTRATVLSYLTNRIRAIAIPDQEPAKAACEHKHDSQ